MEAVKSIGIIGGGVVGQATARTYLEHVDKVVVYDVIKERYTGTLGEAAQCDLVFICLPTPRREDGSADVSLVDEAVTDMKMLLPYKAAVVIKSTVPIGTTRALRAMRGVDVIHSPEFLTARCAFTDAQLPSRNIIGGPVESVAKLRLTELYLRRFPGVQLQLMTSDESELVKLAVNSFFAVKVEFFNELRDIVEKLGRRADWNTVLRSILSDGRISHSHTKVPGHDGRRGFGGACLPKDLSSLVNCFDLLDLPDPMVMKAAMIANEERRSECPPNTTAASRTTSSADQATS